MKYAAGTDKAGQVIPPAEFFDAYYDNNNVALSSALRLTDGGEAELFEPLYSYVDATGTLHENVQAIVLNGSETSIGLSRTVSGSSEPIMYICTTPASENNGQGLVYENNLVLSENVPLIIADGCAEVVNQMWNGVSSSTGLMLFVCSLLFTFQIYADFSGYSDIAIGCAKLFGIKLTTNFRVPYFSRNVREFWRRWHITLMGWFTQYVYFPLGGSRCSRSRTVLNTIIVFALSGLWHGADWTFVLWGLYHALLFIPLIVLGSQRHRDTVAHGRILPTWREFASMVVTFLLINFGWILFRAPDFASFSEFVSRLFSSSLFNYHGLTMKMATMLAWCAALLVMEWIQRERQHVLQIDGYRLLATRPARLALYAFIVFLIFYFAGKVQTFIYFQF